jgi:threonine dehydrogenase-like Zn-dependent dehydrogenase
MKRLLLEGTATVRWEEVDEPQITDPGQAVVAPIAVATCDLDVGVLHGTYPLPGPYPFGHEGVAVVTQIGDDVWNVAVGDRVIVPFQISCGECASCRRGRTGNCERHPRMSTYGLGTMGGLEWGGLLADLTLVPHADAMLVALPDHIDPVSVASASDNIPDGWRTVGPQLETEPGAEVLVVGGEGGPKSIGLYAAGLAVAAGAGRVVYLDHDADRLKVAAALGADVFEVDATKPLPRKVGAFPITVVACGATDGLHCALNSTAADGTCTSASLFLDDPKLPMFAMYSRCCTLHTGRAHVRPAIPKVLELMAAGFDPSLVTTTVASWDDAVEALADPSMKVVLTRDV